MEEITRNVAAIWHRLIIFARMCDGQLKTMLAVNIYTSCDIPIVLRHHLSMRTSPDSFYQLAATFTSIHGDRTNEANARLFRGLFGVSAEASSFIWNNFEQYFVRHTRPFHLLWTLPFLKCGFPQLHEPVL